MWPKGDEGECDTGMGGRDCSLISPDAQTGLGENFSFAPVMEDLKGSASVCFSPSERQDMQCWMKPERLLDNSCDGSM